MLLDVTGNICSLHRIALAASRHEDGGSGYRMAISSRLPPSPWRLSWSSSPLCAAVVLSGEKSVDSIPAVLTPPPAVRFQIPLLKAFEGAHPHPCGVLGDAYLPAPECKALALVLVLALLSRLC